MSQCSVGMGWNETECWLKRNEERLGVCLCLFERRGEISNFRVLLKCEDRKLILLHLVKFCLYHQKLFFCKDIATFLFI